MWKVLDKYHGKEDREKEHHAKNAEIERIQTAKRTVTCKTDAVCVHWYLHRFRKTCATRWHHEGIPVRSIQHWLGHKTLENHSEVSRVG